MRIIAVDPGTRLCGWACFVDGAPVGAGVVKSKADDLVQRADDMTGAMFSWDYDIVIVEGPVIYPDTPQRDNDIVDLALVAGYIASGVSREARAVLMPTPREWKGTVPKHIHNERTRAKCPAAVELVERDVPKGQRNHVWDAVGLALWYLEGKGSR